VVNVGVLQGSPEGKVLVYYPHNRTTHVLADGFYYANGVALSADGSYLVVAETNRIRLHKLWLTGAQVRGQAGRSRA
jgi:sugar lactone lactonase YvrE